MPGQQQPVTQRPDQKAMSTTRRRQRKGSLLAKLNTNFDNLINRQALIVFTHMIYELFIIKALHIAVYTPCHIKSILYFIR